MSQRFLSFDEVKKRSALSRTTLWRLERKGSFPRRHKISDNRVAWLEHEVDEWITSKSAPKPTAPVRA